MKKIICFLVLTLGLMTACNKDAVEPVNNGGQQLVPEKKEKKIKSILLNNWDVSGQKQRFIDSQKTVFDKDGRVVEEVKYHNSGEELERLLYQYDDKGLNNETVLYQKGEVRYRYKMTYNEQGKLIRKDWLLADNTLELSNKLTYEADGAVLDVLYYKENVEEANRYIYNDKGLLLKKLFLAQDDFNQTTGLEVYAYNDEGLMTLKAIYKGADANDDSKIEEKKVWDYDDKSAPMSYELYGANNELRVKIAYTAVFDDYGNWIELMGKTEQWGNNSPTFIERKIEYFD